MAFYTQREEKQGKTNWWKLSLRIEESGVIVI